MATLGVDTSCYRTSLALVEGDAILGDVRRLVEVPEGGRGVRQSEGLFQHVERIGALCEALFAGAPGARVDAVCVSTRPRPVEGSYMPVFLAGEAVARAIAAAQRVPLFTTSHQQGHLRAAMRLSGAPQGEMLAMHLSGGTTELLRVSAQWDIELLGGTTDLHAGQLVDRIGVKLGLPFPAGPALEELCAGGQDKSLIPTANKGLALSLSGAEAQLVRMLSDGLAPADAACEVYSFLARTLAKLIEAGVRESGLHNILIAGGVAASKRLREMLLARLKRRKCPVNGYFGAPELSGDNAVGVALIGEEAYRKALRAPGQA
ncbi:MAG: O-sialoglycoprotein endopeptidase [Clostridia bacterium]